MKTCSGCNKDKSLEEFHRQSSSKDGYRGRCKVCIKKVTDAWYEKNGPRARDYHREYDKRTRFRKKAKSYGLSEDELHALFVEQQGHCKICDEWVGNDKLYIDHCHQKGNVRSLLCLQCNTGLGNFKDRVDLLQSAIDYLSQVSHFSSVGRASR